MNRLLEKEHLVTDLAAVDDLLANAPEDDVVGRIGLAARRSDIAEAIAALGTVDSRRAHAALLFGGRPVIGNLGIDTDFAGKALIKYEDLVTKVWGGKQHGARLGRSGPIPDRQAARLHITGLVQGSFGFELSELSEGGGNDGVPLRDAVEQATRAIIAASESDDALADSVDALGDRAFVALRDFFSVLKKSDASLRVVSDELERFLSTEAVAAAADRTSDSQVKEDEITIRGTFSAVLPEGRRFEFKTEDDKLIVGRVDDELTVADLGRMNAVFAGKTCSGRFFVVSLTRSSGGSRSRYVLLGLDE